MRGGPLSARHGSRRRLWRRRALGDRRRCPYCPAGRGFRGQMTTPSSRRHPPDEIARPRSLRLRELLLTRKASHADAFQAIARVLVIADEPKIADFVSRALSSTGLVVESATDGAQALEIVPPGRYALLFRD